MLDLSFNLETEIVINRKGETIRISRSEAPSSVPLITFTGSPSFRVNSQSLVTPRRFHHATGDLFLLEQGDSLLAVEIGKKRSRILFEGDLSWSINRAFRLERAAS